MAHMRLVAGPFDRRQGVLVYLSITVRGDFLDGRGHVCMYPSGSQFQCNEDSGFLRNELSSWCCVGIPSFGSWIFWGAIRAIFDFGGCNYAFLG